MSADWCLGKIVGKGINGLRGRRGIQDTVTGEEVSSGSLSGRSQLAEMTQRQSFAVAWTRRSSNECGTPFRSAPSINYPITYFC